MGILKKTHIQHYLLIFITSFILFSNTISHEYAWDDKIVIEKNPRVQKGISGIPDLFIKYKSQYQYDQYGYRPITLSSLAIDYSISKGNPHFSHFMNVFYNAVLSVLIFILLSTLFSSYHPVFNILITLLFVSHPLHVEVVANIKSRDEILGLLFSAISLLFFVKFIDSKKWIFIAISLFAYLLGYLSKENSITMLATFPLVFIIRRSSFSIKNLVIYSVSFVLLFGASYIIYKYAENSTAQANITEGLGIYQEDGILGNSFMHVGKTSTKIANAFHILVRYLKNFLIPYPLVYYYGTNMIPSTGWSNLAVWFSVLIHGFLFFIGIKKIKTRPEILFGLLFYLVNISVYTHVLRTLSDTMADRFLFTASLGLCILLVGLLGLAFKINWNDLVNSKTKKQISSKEWLRSNKIISGVLIVVVLVFSGLTMSRNNVWKDDFTLVTHDLPYMENCARAHYYYASMLNKQIAENHNKKGKLESTMIKHYKRSMEISDYSYLSYLELGTYYCREGNNNEGLSVLKKGIQLFPKATDLHFFVGQTYVLVNQPDSAVPYLERSMEAAYNTPTNYYFLGIAYGRTDQLSKAIETMEKGKKKFPDQLNLMYDALGHIYFDNGLLDKSIESTFMQMQHGKDLKSGYSDIIGRCYAAGEKEKGDQYLKEAQSKGVVF